MPTITAVKYLKYQLEDGNELREVSVMFQRADWHAMWHVIIEDKEENSPDYYFMNNDDILKYFGPLKFLNTL